MKTRSQRLILSGMILTLAVLFLCTGVFKKTESFSGYIPTGEMPKIFSMQSSSSSPLFTSKSTIHVVIDKKDTVRAYMNNEYFLGSGFIFHKEKYFLVTGGIIFVRGYMIRGQYFIEEAWIQL